MKTYPILHVAHPLDRDADLLALTMLAESDLADFRSEIAHELGALLSIDRVAALSFVDLRPGDSIGCPVPECFTLAPAVRKSYAVDIARALRFALGGVGQVAA